MDSISSDLYNLSSHVRLTSAIESRKKNLIVLEHAGTVVCSDVATLYLVLSE